MTRELLSLLDNGWLRLYDEGTLLVSLRFGKPAVKSGNAQLSSGHAIAAGVVTRWEACKWNGRVLWTGTEGIEAAFRAGDLVRVEALRLE